MAALTVKDLTADTWDDFAALVEAHNGVWGGCWCIAFHEEGWSKDPDRNHRAQKEARVRSGQAHAALVYDGDACVGWCQFGPTAELPRIKHQKAYREGLTAAALPDWRITCFFVHKTHRGQGVADAALAGALASIAQAGGGMVESYPEATDGRKVAAAFLHNAGLAMFDRHGFTRERMIGKHRWVVKKTVSAA
jgi:GNAT superfamily N-acetyltransferase